MTDEQTIEKLVELLAPFANAAFKGYVLYDAVEQTIKNDLYHPVLLAEPMNAAMYKTKSHLCWNDFKNVMEFFADNEHLMEKKQNAGS